MYTFTIPGNTVMLEEDDIEWDFCFDDGDFFDVSLTDRCIQNILTRVASIGEVQDLWLCVDNDGQAYLFLDCEENGVVHYLSHEKILPNVLKIYLTNMIQGV